MKENLTYRFHATGVADALEPGQWAVWEGELEHPDGTIQEAWCQGGYEGMDCGDLAEETLEDENGDQIVLPKGARLI